MKDQSNGAGGSNRESDDQAVIWKSIERIKDCMMVTKDGAALHGRPMRAIARPADNAIYFITAKSTHKPEEIAADSHACLGFADRSARTYISISGMIAMSDDPERLKALWSPDDDAYFSSGAADPDAMLLKFLPDSAEYWESPSNPVTLAVAFIKAKVSGEKPSLGEHARVEMQ